jgi:hypothetical protein
LRCCALGKTNSLHLLTVGGALQFILSTDSALRTLLHTNLSHPSHINVTLRIASTRFVHIWQRPS